VLLNIIVNAAQAIRQRNQNEKGLITIGTDVEGGYVCCYIGDNGCGMKEDVMKRIFEPFFTTKSVGKGTGLGLSLAYDIIVNKHGGKLEVASEEGVGTCFKILIPINQNREKDESF
jgi:signal transduction histidine kinase